MRTEDPQGVTFREWVLNYIQYYYLIVLHKKYNNNTLLALAKTSGKTVKKYLKLKISIAFIPNIGLSNKYIFRVGIGDILILLTV
jgi:hypothetical protein